MSSNSTASVPAVEQLLTADYAGHRALGRLLHSAGAEHTYEWLRSECERSRPHGDHGIAMLYAWGQFTAIVAFEIISSHFIAAGAPEVKAIFLAQVTEALKRMQPTGEATAHATTSA